MLFLSRIKKQRTISGPRLRSAFCSGRRDAHASFVSFSALSWPAACVCWQKPLREERTGKLCDMYKYTYIYLRIGIRGEVGRASCTLVCVYEYRRCMEASLSRSICARSLSASCNIQKVDRYPHGVAIRAHSRPRTEGQGRGKRGLLYAFRFGPAALYTATRCPIWDIPQLYVPVQSLTTKSANSETTSLNGHRL